MNQHLQTILNFIQESTHLSDEEKAALTKAAKDANKEIEITAFKLDRTEKVKRTTAILLEEAIEELEQKRKAVETQNHELQIEAALERVRAVAMEMKQSNELITVCDVMYKELLSLGFSNIRNAQIAIENDTRQSYFFYVYSDFEKIIGGEAHYESSAIVQRLYNELGKSGDGLYEREYSPEEMIEWRSWRNSLSPLLDEREATVKSLCWYMYSIGKGHIGISTFNPITKEQVEVVKRFRKVFELSYTRFDDLQKAEAQARESEIELALERVRARTMAMQHSDELAEASLLLDSQVRSLGIKTRGCAFNIYGDGESTEWFSSEMGTMPTYKTPREGFFLRNYEAGLSGKSMNIETFAGEACKAHYEYLCTLPVMGDALKAMIAAGGSFPKQQTDHAVYFKYGYLLFITLEPVPEAHDIFIRFAKVFEQTYTRFLDLQKAEAQSREAQIEVALERVRSKAMAMHKSEDLQGAVAVVFEELNKLNLGVLRVGISVLNKEKRTGHVWLTSVDEDKAVQVYGDESFDIHPLMQGSMDAWINQHDFYYVLEGEDLTNYYKAIQSEEFNLPASQMLASSGNEHRKQACYVAVYNSGGVFAFRDNEFPDEAKAVMKRFASVFDLTYKRFLDIQKAEAQAMQAQLDLIEIKAARQKAENALTELQAAQKQLVQSEKMASLGELTAGIAHEIQNPLNFVNNFSEVSKELIDEMKAELDAGNTADAIEIANDLIQNMEKINHHGKRADAIVKGMLQHSRTSTNQKEATDINVLVDEYIRLCYHGLRAKDNSFNAAINTDFSNDINKISIIPQDIGRVILNILTNAFYAVNEKQKTRKNFKPTVAVSTKNANNKIEIIIADNGNGIPKNIVDKIFQPFFTTKPTGSGTGLGLSLSYDIIKAHDGEIKVETKEGDGSTFIILLNT